MSALNDLFERAVIGLVTRVSGRTVAALAIVLYPGAGLVLPLALHWSIFQLIEANVLGTTFAGVISLRWLSAQVEAAKRRHLVEWTTDLRLLSAEEFKWLVGETLRREGWKVRETGRQDAPDGNVDLELTRDGQGLPGTAGIFVILSDFTEQARTEARKTCVTLLDGRGLYSKVQNARRPEPCPPASNQ